MAVADGLSAGWERGVQNKCDSHTDGRSVRKQMVDFSDLFGFVHGDR
jgi:hypothetical protein